MFKGQLVRFVSQWDWRLEEDQSWGLGNAGLLPGREYLFSFMS